MSRGILNTLWVLLLSLALPVGAATLKTAPCAAPTFSDANIKQIVSRERLVRTDLPPPFEKQQVNVLRDGCYYIYQEFNVPATPGMSVIMKLDQYGVIVDVIYGH